MSDADISKTFSDLINKPLVDKLSTEINVAKATERAIVMGKEISLLLENELPLTRCLVARVLGQTYRMRFPKLWEMMRKLGL